MCGGGVGGAGVSGLPLRKLLIAIQHHLPDLSLELLGDVRSRRWSGMKAGTCTGHGRPEDGPTRSPTDGSWRQSETGHRPPAESEAAYHRCWEHTALAA